MSFLLLFFKDLISSFKFYCSFTFIIVNIDRNNPHLKAFRVLSNYWEGRDPEAKILKPLSTTKAKAWAHESACLTLNSVSIPY